MSRNTDPVKVLEHEASRLTAKYKKLDDKYIKIKEEKDTTFKALQKVLKSLEAFQLPDEEISETDQVLSANSPSLLVEAEGRGIHSNDPAAKVLTQPPPDPRLTCPACMTEGSLYNSQKTFQGSGKSIPVTVCMECSYETLGHKV